MHSSTNSSAARKTATVLLILSLESAVQDVGKLYKKIKLSQTFNLLPYHQTQQVLQQWHEKGTHMPQVGCS